MSFKELTAHEHLATASSNANFTCDFSTSASLAPVTATARSYDDIIDAIHDLSTFTNEFSWDHVRRLIARLRMFVTKNKSSGNDTQAQVELTLHHVDMFLGRALAHLVSESPMWWARYCDALRDIEYESKEWTIALVEMQHQQLAKHAQRQYNNEPPRRNNNISTDRLRDRQAPRQHTPTGVPDDIRKLITKSKHGKEPCLRFVGGSMCSGTREKCDNRWRHHDSTEHMDPTLIKWANERYGRRT